MAKTKEESDSVKIKRGSQSKTVSRTQWNSMKANKATYGWIAASEIPADVKSKEQELESTQIQALKKQNEALEAENATLREKLAAYADHTPDANLTKVPSVLDNTLDDLPGELAKIESVDDLNALKVAEAQSEASRKGAVKAIEARIAELTPKA